ncbi:L-histidine N(alpha)-methyltransferase [cyanobiont of Ornithocercus magnificus]|nr:L-histidine N(alpha)-methyltransferase [cyanobiont of Ornithocercus magnificus]
MKFPAANLIDLHPAPADMKRLVCQGLRRRPRQLPAWFLYDIEGSKLFDRICEQPEYSLMRTETRLIEQQASAIAQELCKHGQNLNTAIIEFGAGSARKVGPLLQALKPDSYIALDISYTHLQLSIESLQRLYPDVSVLGICCDHSKLEKLPAHPLIGEHHCIGFFPGSSLGNFSSEEAVALLKGFRRLLNGGPLLLGLDHPKAPSRLEAAYNDAAGVSAAFARNLLKRLNLELRGDFIVEQFDYRACWQPEHRRIAMALISCQDQQVNVAGQRWNFSSGEELITEYSVKYDPRAACSIAAQAGWRCRTRWHDPDDDLSLHLLETSA